MATNIQVAIRIRPFLPFEAGSKSCIDVLPGDSANDTTASSSASNRPITQGKSVRISSSHSHHNKDGHTFTFDKCFSGHATQVELYQTCVVPLLNKCLEGYNATTLAYGQTGAGEFWREAFVCLFVCFLLLLMMMMFGGREMMYYCTRDTLAWSTQKNCKSDGWMVYFALILHTNCPTMKIVEM